MQMDQIMKGMALEIHMLYMEGISHQEQYSMEPSAAPCTSPITGLRRA